MNRVFKIVIRGSHEGDQLPAVVAKKLNELLLLVDAGEEVSFEQKIQIDVSGEPFYFVTDRYATIDNSEGEKQNG